MRERVKEDKQENNSKMMMMMKREREKKTYVGSLVKVIEFVSFSSSSVLMLASSFVVDVRKLVYTNHQ